MNEFYNWKNHELKDKEIINALKQAAEDYENGEVAEVQSVCSAIANAIQEFTDEDKLRYGGRN